MKEGFRWCPHCREPHSLSSRYCPSTGLQLEKELHAKVAALPRHALAGLVVGDQYEVTHRIGVGGMNEVFEARDVRTRARVALKVVKDDNAEAAARLRQEAGLLASLRHPNVCAVLGAGTMPDGRPYIAFERLEGETLASRLHGRGRLRPGFAVAIFRQILDGLAAAHERGVIHRDLKPSNVFLVDQGGRVPVAKLLDFGLAVDTMRRSRRMTRPGRAPGTPRYMSPEQLIGAQITPASDVFAVGIMLYEALSGEHPFDGDNAREVARKTVFEREVDLGERLPRLPYGLAAVVRSALCKSTVERPRSAAHMEHALANFDAPDDEPPESSDSRSTANSLY